MATHPGWLMSMARHGQPRFETLSDYAESGASAPSLAEYAANHVTDALDVGMLAKIREAWPGKLVVKGVMDAASAVASADLGADGIVVSNHGGRQFDAAPATIDVLPGIVAAVSSRVTVMFDGGVRSGLDVLRAFSLGAQFAFSGRSFAFGAAAGPSGASRAFAIFRDDILRGLAQLGVDSIDHIRSRI